MSSVLSTDEPLDSLVAEVTINCPAMLAWGALAQQDKLYTACTRASVKAIEMKVSGNPLALETTFTFVARRNDRGMQHESVILKKMTVGETLVYRRKKKITTKILGIFPKTELSGTRVDEMELRPDGDHACVLKLTERFSALSARMRAAAEQGVRSKVAMYQKFVEGESRNDLWDFVRNNLKTLGLPIPATPAGVLGDKSLTRALSINGRSNTDLPLPRTPASALAAADKKLMSSASSQSLSQQADGGSASSQSRSPQRSANGSNASLPTTSQEQEAASSSSERGSSAGADEPA